MDNNNQLAGNEKSPYSNESFLTYIEKDKVVMNMITTDTYIQEKIRKFLQEEIIPYSKDRLGLHQIFVSSTPVSENE